MTHPLAKEAFLLLVYCLGALLVGIGFLSVILRPLADEKERDHPGCLWLGFCGAMWLALWLSRTLARAYAKDPKPPQPPEPGDQP